MFLLCRGVLNFLCLLRSQFWWVSCMKDACLNFSNFVESQQKKGLKEKGRYICCISDQIAHPLPITRWHGFAFLGIIHSQNNICLTATHLYSKPIGWCVLIRVCDFLVIVSVSVYNIQAPLNSSKFLFITIHPEVSIFEMLDRLDSRLELCILLESELRKGRHTLGIVFNRLIQAKAYFNFRRSKPSVVIPH